MNNLNDYYKYLNNYADMNLTLNPYNMMNSTNYGAVFPTAMEMKNTNNIASSQTGFQRGNMFNNTYSEYNGYKPANLKATSEREDLLMQIDEQRFAMIDLGLYLDVYPNDKNILNEYNNHLKKEQELINTYENKYGPLSLTSKVQTNNWLWNNSPWSWEVQN